MKRLLGIIFIGSLLIATYLFLATLLSKTGIIIVWTAVFLIIIAEIFVLYSQKKKETDQKDNWDYYENLWLTQEPRGLGLPEPYINGLPQIPLLKQYFNTGQEYEKADKHKDAINEYNKCLTHPKAPPIK